MCISNNRALYEAGSVEECIKAEVYECSWVPEESTYKWYTEQDQEKDETVIYANFHGADPNEENVEINVPVNALCHQKQVLDISQSVVS